MARVQIGALKPVHRDSRRSISEFNGEDFAVTGFEVATNLPLGNHHHERKTEMFIVTKGAGMLLTQHEGPIDLNALSEGSVVNIPPHVAHTFVLDPGSEMLCHSSARFDPNDQDMIPHPLKMPIAHIGSVVIVYRASDPSQIYIDIKDDGLPVKVFRRTLCFVGGNWIGEAAKGDVGPLMTMRREVGEELSFEKPLRSSLELAQLDLATAEQFAPVAVQDIAPSDQDRSDLAHLKQKITEAAVPFGDYVLTVTKDVFDSGDSENKRGDLTYLCSYHAVCLGEDDWAKLVSLQRKFGNLSNESISTITSLDEILRTQTKSAYGHDRVLQDFFRSHGLDADGVPLFPGPDPVRIGMPRERYEDYRAVFDIAKMPL